MTEFVFEKAGFGKETSGCDSAVYFNLENLNFEEYRSEVLLEYGIMSSAEKSCGYCGQPPRRDEAGNEIKMKTCSRCKSVYYHDIDCQKRHWKLHKKSCGQPKPSQHPLSSMPDKEIKQKHRSMNPVHQLVTRRFKELRSQGVSAHEAMQKARAEFQPSEDHELDPASEGTVY